MNEHGQRRPARSLLLAATAALAAACSGQDPIGSETQELSGQVARHNFTSQVIGVRAVRGQTAVAWSPVDSDGRFDLAVPSGQGYRLEVVTRAGSHGFVARGAGSAAALEFDVCAGEAPFDVGHVHSWSRAESETPGEGCDDPPPPPCGGGSAPGTPGDPNGPSDPGGGTPGHPGDGEPGDPGCPQPVPCDDDGNCCFPDGTCCSADGTCCFPDGTCTDPPTPCDPDAGGNCEPPPGCVPGPDGNCDDPVPNPPCDPDTGAGCVDPAPPCQPDGTGCNDPAPPCDPNSGEGCDDPVPPCAPGEDCPQPPQPCEPGPDGNCCAGDDCPQPPPCEPGPDGSCNEPPTPCDYYDDPTCWPEPQPPVCSDATAAGMSDACWADGAVPEKPVPDFGCAGGK